jgi:hypothetical protein
LKIFEENRKNVLCLGVILPECVRHLNRETGKSERRQTIKRILWFHFIQKRKKAAEAAFS